MTPWPKIISAMSTVDDGTMRLPLEGEDTAGAAENRRTFLAKFGFTPEHMASARLRHGAVVEVVGDNDGGRMFDQADGLVTNVPGMVLSVTGADCPPILYYDPRHNAIGIAHSGWRGFVQNIPAAVVKTMTGAYKTKPTDLLVHIGPGICRRHFEVHSDVADQFQAYPPAIVNNSGTITIDLKVVGQMQLVAAGVQTKNIDVDPTCTFEDTHYFSYRRDKPADLQAMMAILALPFPASPLD
jgi:YfiH family protein